ncbi:hypothetical protein ACI2LF_33285 [Kribbella sp. NPDC020789]
MTTEDVTTTAAPAPIAGARRRLSPRPVPVSRRRKSAAPVPGAGEEPNPAEEMGDVGKDDTAKAAEAEKVAAGPEETPAGAGATATKTAKPRTAAEIVAEQKAREQAAASEAESHTDDTTATKPVSRVPAAAAKTSTTPVKTTTAAKAGATGKQALSSVGTGVRQLRNLIASIIWLVAVLAAAMLALGALFTALDQTNQSNEIVRWVLERGHELVGPFKDLFRLETAKNTLLVNWGIAALVYLIAGKILERFIRP